MEKLSSGLRINRASDDSAGLAIREKMRGQIRGLEQANRNIQDGISLIQTADGSLNEVHSILQRIRELSVQASNGTLIDSDRIQIQQEISQLKCGIDSIANNTEFNTKKLLDGSIGVTPAKTAIAPTASIDTTNGGNGKTVLDGWIPFGVNGARIKINANEQIQNDEPYNLYIEWTNGLPTGFNIDKWSGLVVVNMDFQAINPPQLTYSVNGVTFDVSQANLGMVVSGNQSQGTVVFHAGSNGSPATPAVNNSLILQVGSNAMETMDLQFSGITCNNLGINNVDVSTQFSAESAIGLIDNAINQISSERSQCGVYQNALEHLLNNVNNYNENLTSSESRISDIDMAKEMMEMSKNFVLEQVSESLLAQVNQIPNRILDLLK